MIDRYKTRATNLAALLAELTSDGVMSLREQADMLGVAEGLLSRLMSGEPVSDAVVQEMEWGMQKPQGWMDEDHSTGVL